MACDCSVARAPIAIGVSSLMVLFDSLLAWLVSVVGVATGAAYIPQALRIWKRRSSDDVSILTYLLFLGGQIVYLVYGIRIRQWPLIIGMSANIVGSVAVILSAVRFRAGSTISMPPQSSIPLDEERESGADGSRAG
jgi:MtN3 and saliva related transmembrane protein